MLLKGFYKTPTVVIIEIWLTVYLIVYKDIFTPSCHVEELLYKHIIFAQHQLLLY